MGEGEGGALRKGGEKKKVKKRVSEELNLSHGLDTRGEMDVGCDILS